MWCSFTNGHRRTNCAAYQREDYKSREERIIVKWRGMEKVREDLFDNLIERREYFRHLQKGIKRTMLNNSIPYNYTVDIVRQGEEGVKNGRPAIENTRRR